MSNPMTTPTDAQVEAALVAGRSDRIQGFHYPPRYVIRDVYLSPEKQEIWSCDMSEPDAEDRFYHQCEIERERVKLTAAFSLAPAGTVEVKPLEWGRINNRWYGYAPKGSGMPGYIVRQGEWWRRDGTALKTTCGTDTEAKAGAQADYEQRIRSALLPPQPSAVNATDLIGAERHKCASLGPCSGNGDGCSCSDAELLRRAALTSMDRRV